MMSSLGVLFLVCLVVFVIVASIKYEVEQEKTMTDKDRELRKEMNKFDYFYGSNKFQ